jgi:hypothetical protein
LAGAHTKRECDVREAQIQVVFYRQNLAAAEQRLAELEAAQ